ncbi:thrombospondin type 3 repeat-containing protein [Myxococcota bacterium]|nr:thrombospondin type 3 repeat-containing protein [Myxococcota bacterium]
MKRILALLCGTLALAYAASSHAGAFADFDGDLVPDLFDNCRTVANGPNQGSNQTDDDLDGYGNRCDTDFDQSCTTTVADFSRFLERFGQNVCGPVDFDGSCTITVADFAIFLTKFANPPGAPGPSGLTCANCLVGVPCTP